MLSTSRDYVLHTFLICCVAAIKLRAILQPIKSTKQLCGVLFEHRVDFVPLSHPRIAGCAHTHTHIHILSQVRRQLLKTWDFHHLFCSRKRLDLIFKTKPLIITFVLYQKLSASHFLDIRKERCSNSETNSDPITLRSSLIKFSEDGLIQLRIRTWRVIAFTPTLWRRQTTFDASELCAARKGIARIWTSVYM